MQHVSSNFASNAAGKRQPRRTEARSVVESCRNRPTNQVARAGFHEGVPCIGQRDAHGMHLATVMSQTIANAVRHPLSEEIEHEQCK